MSIVFFHFLRFFKIFGKALPINTGCYGEIFFATLKNKRPNAMFRAINIGREADPLNSTF